MADHSLYDAEPLRRPRRGPAPRLYVISRQSAVPWLRVRRLNEADRPALVAHFVRLAAADRRPRSRGALDEAGIASLCSALDFRRVVAFGAIAGNAIIAAACGVPGLEGLEIGATEDPDYRERGLGAMLVSQVMGAAPGAIAQAPSPGDAEQALLRLLPALGGRIEQDAALLEDA
ncbi:MAG: hypothetical protein ACOYOH_08965 [Paracraurococcus sp.]|jgi:hypothetical protein